MAKEQSVEIWLEWLGRAVASMGMLATIGGMLGLFFGRGTDGGDSKATLYFVLVIGGVSACISGLMAWGLSAVVSELKRIRSVLERPQDRRP